MGLILIPSEVAEEAELLKSLLIETAESYRGALQVIQDFSNDEDIDTDSWDTLKTKVLDYHQAIGQGVILAEDSILTDTAALEQSVGTEELYEDMLVESIKKLEEEQKECQAEISRLQSIRNNFIVGLFDSIVSWIDNYIMILNNELEKIEQVLEVLREKLQFLYDAESSTQGLFNSSIQLLKAVWAAINDAGVEITGQGSKSGIDWKITISNAAAEMDKKIESFIEEALQSELNIDLDELKEMYGEDVVNRLKKIMEEHGISRLVDGSEEKFVKAVLESITGFYIVKINGQYEYINKSGNKSSLTMEIIYKKFEIAVYVASSEKIAQWYVGNVPTYCQMTKSEIDDNGGPSTAGGRSYYQCDLSGELTGLKVGDDCSSFLWATLVQSGYFSSDTIKYTSSEYLPNGAASAKMQEAGFTWHSMSELDGSDLQAGDILVKNGHVEIFYDYENQQEMALTWGVCL